MRAHQQFAIISESQGEDQSNHLDIQYAFLDQIYLRDITTLIFSTSALYFLFLTEISVFARQNAL